MSVIDRKREVLAEVFGHEDFRAGQEGLVDAALEGRDVRAVMPTGSGKSLAYQLPAVMDEKRTTIVVSPLIALMREQADYLSSLGISADALHSGNAEQKNDYIRAQVAQGALRVLYVSPERLRKGDFVESVSDAALARVVVDEAHCISKWGHDFRPEYRGIREFVDAHEVGAVSAFTATASANVLADITDNLRLGDPYVYDGEIYRPNLSYEVVPVSGRDKTAHVKSLIDKYAPGDDDAVIVYCGKRAQTFGVCEGLKELGLDAEYYNAGRDPSDRADVEKSFKSNEVKILVATNAFGMGVDKPNIRLVVHYSIPGSVEAYLQETGRAGRDGDPAQCVLLYSANDIGLQEFFAMNKAPSLEFVKAVYDTLHRQSTTRRGGRVGNGFYTFDRKALHKAFPAPRKNQRAKQNFRKVSVDAAVDLLVNRGILQIIDGGYVKFNVDLKPGDDRWKLLEEAVGMKARISNALLGQMVEYAKAKKPTQQMLIELLQSELKLED